MRCANPKCGREFKPKYKQQKYCSAHCCNVMNRSPYQGKPKAEREPKATVSTKPLEQWEAEARACNLDYGTYCALLALGKTFEELKATASTRTRLTHSKKYSALRRQS